MDHTRDETLPSLGVHVHDEPDNECTWLVLPPERRRGRQERLEEEEREQQVGAGESDTDTETEAGEAAELEEGAEPGGVAWADGKEVAQQPRVGDAGRRRE